MSQSFTGNYLRLYVLASHKNESLIRCILASFCLPLEPTVEELNDIKTAVSEAVANSVVHGYDDYFKKRSKRQKDCRCNDADRGVTADSQPDNPPETIVCDDRKEGMMSSDRLPLVEIEAEINDKTLTVTVSDTGCGISDLHQAMQPFFTTKPDSERSGMGFTVMEAFSDTLEVTRNQPQGVRVKMTKTFRG